MRFAAVLLLALAPGAQTSDSLFDCQAKPSQCQLICADCPPGTTNDCTNNPTRYIDCGTPTTAGLSQTDIAWATPGYCFKYSATLFDADNGCDYPKYATEPGPIVCGVLAILAILFWIVWPWARACCGCCGGETVNTESFCCGQPDAGCCCPCCDPPTEAERISGAKYFEPMCDGCDNCACNILNPYHPCGARYLYPSALLAVSIIAMGICIAAAKDVAQSVDDVLDAGITTIDLSLRSNLNVATGQLAVAKTTCTICQAPSTTCNTIDSVLVQLDDIIKRAQQKLVDLKGKPGTEGLKDGITTAGYVLGTISICGSALALVFGLCQCSRLSGICGCEGCCGGCFIWVALQLVLLIFVCVSILLAFISVSSQASTDLCTEIDQLKVSPPVVTGSLGARYIAEACFYEEIQSALNRLPTKVQVAGCPQFEDAIDVLRGNTRRTIDGVAGKGRGGVFEGIGSCPRLVHNIGTSFSKSCGSLKDGIKQMEAALAIECAVLVGCVLIYWLGYKRWVSEDHVIMPKTTEPYDAEEMKPTE